MFDTKEAALAHEEKLMKRRKRVGDISKADFCIMEEIANRHNAIFCKMIPKVGKLRKVEIIGCLRALDEKKCGDLLSMYKEDCENKNYDNLYDCPVKFMSEKEYNEIIRTQVIGSKLPYIIAENPYKLIIGKKIMIYVMQVPIIR